MAGIRRRQETQRRTSEHDDDKPSVQLLAYRPLDNFLSASHVITPELESYIAQSQKRRVSEDSCVTSRSSSITSKYEVTTDGSFDTSFTNEENEEQSVEIVKYKAYDVTNPPDDNSTPDIQIYKSTDKNLNEADDICGDSECFPAKQDCETASIISSQSGGHRNSSDLGTNDADIDSDNGSNDLKRSSSLRNATPEEAKKIAYYSKNRHEIKKAFSPLSRVGGFRKKFLQGLKSSPSLLGVAAHAVEAEGESDSEIDDRNHDKVKVSVLVAIVA